MAVVLNSSPSIDLDSRRSTEVSQTVKPVGPSQDECVINDAPRLFDTFEVGDVSHQGDIIIVGIAKLPKSAKPRHNRQLAEGNTQGSRHVLENGDIFDADPTEVAELIFTATGCQLKHTPPRASTWETVDENYWKQYIGPVFVAPEVPTANDLTHPEHGDQGFPAGTVCAVVYQRSLDVDGRARRVID